MALTPSQIAGLNAASERKLAKTASAEDIKNLDYAAGQGYTYTPAPSVEKAPVQEAPIYPSVVTPNAPATTPTPTGTLSSNLAEARKKTDEEYITSVKAQDAEMAASAKSLLESNLAGIERTYAQREREAKESYGEQEASKSVEQFRLGTKGTPYGSAEIEKANAKKQAYFDNLAAEKASKITELTLAYQKNDYERVAKLRDDIYKVQAEQQKFLSDERTKQINEYKTMTELGTTKAQTLAPALFASLGSDPVKNAQIIQDFARENGVDANVMMSAALTYQTDKQKEDMLNASNVANILKGTKSGGVVNIPGVGDVTIIGQKEQAPSTLTVGNKVYNYLDGKWTDTGITADKLTPDQVIDALTKLGDTDLLKNYLSGLGINVGTTPSGPVTVDAFKSAITKQESGNYQAVNKDSGALGAYQIMPFHLSKVGLDGNNPADRQKYLDSPELQDKLFNTMIDDLSKQYNGDTRKMAAAYYGGAGGANALDTPDGDRIGKYNKDGSLTGYPSINEYVNSVMSKAGTKTGQTFDEYSQIQIALSVLPTQLKNSDFELKRAIDGIKKGLKEGKSPYEIADALSGYKIDKPDAFSNNMRTLMGVSPNLKSSDFSEIARLINSGNKSGAIQKIERSVLEGTKAKEKESTSIYSYDYGDKTAKTIQENLDKLGIVSGNWNKMAKKFREDKNFQKLESQLVGTIQEWRKAQTGVATTPTELAMIDSLIPSVKDNPFNALVKIKEFQAMNLNSLNADRQTYGLPRLEKMSLMNNNARVKLYENMNKNIIRVKDKATGQMGSLPEDEFDPNKYDKL